MKTVFSVLVLVLHLGLLLNLAESCLDVCGEAGPCEEACGTNGVCCKKGYQQDGCNGRVGRRTGKCITVGTDEPEQPEEPEEPENPEIELTEHPMDCNANEQIHKMCMEETACAGNIAKGNGFTTYIFKLGSKAMCFHYYKPEGVSGPVPVVMFFQCYSRLRLSGLQFSGANQAQNKAAARYGFARLGLSTLDGGWACNGKLEDDDCITENPWYDTFGIEKPKHYCDTLDLTNADGDYANPKLQYVKTIVGWVNSRPDLFDTSKVYFRGFSQNGLFPGMAQRCFSNQVAGSYTGGCPKLLGSALCGAERKDFLQWPCNVQDRPIVMCSGTQYGDYRYKGDREAGLFDWPKTLECTADEGVNVVRFDWVGNQHGAVKNTDHWMMSCFGLGNKCSEECEGKFMDCMEGKEFEDKEFENCLAGMDTSDSPCNRCTPTLRMMRTATEIHAEYGTENFGNFYPPTGSHGKPDTSTCSAPNPFA